MSSVVIYTGPTRVDLGLRQWQHFINRDNIPEQIKQAIESNSAFANAFEDLSKFRLKPPPGSRAFDQAKVSREPPARRTLIHRVIRRRFR